MPSQAASPPASPSSALLRRFFKRFNPLMILYFRLGLGAFANGTRWGGAVMVLTHTGRRTGLRRRTPLNYAVVDGDVYCLAGFGPIADWYRNVLANPQVEVWLAEGWWAGTASEASSEPEALDRMRRVLIASGFAGRLAGLDALRMSDAELAQATAEYRLVRIRRGAALTGRNGPGDLVWLWPLAGALLALAGLAGRVGRRSAARRALGGG
jgi:deazaflavin-dependent oxidoreductase (nitroreductase family)